MDFFKSSLKPTKVEINKAATILKKACDLGWDCSGYGELDYNKSSGYVYLWLEDYPYSLCIAPSNPSQVLALYSCPYDGEEHFIPVGQSVEVLNRWVEKLQKLSDKKARK